MMHYLFQVNVLLAVFFGFCTLLSGQDTFFRLRRVALLASLLLSWVWPLVDIPEVWPSGVAEAGLTSTLTNVTLPALIVSPQTGGWTWIDALRLVWLCGTIWMLVRLVVGLIRVVMMVRRARVCRIDGLTVRMLPDEGMAPCSFFRWILLPAEGLEREALTEVLRHECVHVRQWHSADVLLAELTVVCCWMNPFAWLLRNAIRVNLEYLADEGVVSSGSDVRTYSYHLLALACPKHVATYTNNFTVLPLKKRIQMMNKQRTNKSLQVKYLLMLPMCALLLVLCNLKVQATPIFPEQGEVVAHTDSVAPVPQNEVVDAPDVMPAFPGGMPALMQFIGNNVKYPNEAIDKKEQGRVLVQFVVTKDGEVANAHVIHSVSASCDAEALRLINMLPRWTPGTVKGQPVNVKFTIPITFRLQK